MKFSLSGSFLILSVMTVCAQSESNTWSVKFSNALIGRYQPNINVMTNKGWEYSNGIMLVGMQKVYNQLSTAATKTSILNYIQAYVDVYVNSSGQVSSDIMNKLGLDGTHPGLLCIFLYQQTALSKYKIAAQHLRDTIMLASVGYPRTPEGGFWHRNDAVNYKNVEYLDGIYMVNPFLAQYGAEFGDAASTDTAVDQAIILYAHNYSSATHLLLHAFDYDKNTYNWANPATGVSTEVWSRGMGWYVMTLVEILNTLPRSYPRYNQLVTMLGNLAAGIKNYQDPTTHLWYDIVDSPKTAAGNYIETSGSGMFIYSLKTAIDSGWISSATYQATVDSAWSGYQKYITTYPGPAINGYAGGPQITSFTPAMGVQKDYATYTSFGAVNVPTNTNTGTQHPHGYAATLMAASAMEFPLTILPVGFTGFTATLNNDDVQLAWQYANEKQIDHFELQKKIGRSEYSSIATIRSTGSVSYHCIDMHVTGPLIYYRVAVVTVDGQTKYSEIAVVDIKSGRPDVQVGPNPVKTNEINLFLNNMHKGRYVLDFINSAGNLLFSKPMDIDGGSTVRPVSLPAGLGKGVYYLRLGGEGRILTNIIIVE
jgi:unsaturated rhamnogalacturonyl hydrolase